MERAFRPFKVEELQQRFGVDIEFPEYQREPNVWSLDQKQRLIDSMLRSFDISSIYFYERADQILDCIDGRQRINAIMSFLGTNANDPDNGFPFKPLNEISEGLPSAFDALAGMTFADLQETSVNGSGLSGVAATAIDTVEGYSITAVLLSGEQNEDEFNLQFLRLNLGTLVNAGEKLHAMVGSMRNLIFESERVGKHEFFDFVRIPTRRYAKESMAAQIVLEVFSVAATGDFARARHADLQGFLKNNSLVNPADPRVLSTTSTLDALVDGAADASAYLKNRAVTVSLILLAHQQNVPSNVLSAAQFWAFAVQFLRRLEWQVGKMKGYERDGEYFYLVEFQRHLTQASVERPAISRRHVILEENLEHWLQHQHLIGDVQYHARTGEWPPV